MWIKKKRVEELGNKIEAIENSIGAICNYLDEKEKRIIEFGNNVSNLLNNYDKKIDKNFMTLMLMIHDVSELDIGELWKIYENAKRMIQKDDEVCTLDRLWKSSI